MKRIFFLGDIHGRYKTILDFIKDNDIKDAIIISVGDFGLGFKSFKKDQKELSMYHNILIKNNVIVYVIRGNHDKPQYFENDPFGFSNIKLLNDYTVLNINDINILCVGGATSTDRYDRYNKYHKKGIYDHFTDNDTWWKDEVFKYDSNKINSFKNIDVVVTHNTTNYCFPLLIDSFSNYIHKKVNEGDSNLITDLIAERNLITNMFDILKENNDIKYHFYGHYHKSNKDFIGDTRHICLDIDEFYELNV